MNILKPMIGALAGAFFLAGCAAVDTARTVVKAKGASVADQTLVDAEWAVCSLAPIGAVKRRYGQTVGRAETYKEFCDGDGRANIVAPNIVAPPE